MTSSLDLPKTVQIKPVSTPEAVEQFLDVPYRIYKNDPHWVAPLRSSEAKQLAEDNPFLSYGSLQAFIAISFLYLCNINPAFTYTGQKDIALGDTIKIGKECSSLYRPLEINMGINSIAFLSRVL